MLEGGVKMVVPIAEVFFMTTRATGTRGLGTGAWADGTTVFRPEGSTPRTSAMASGRFEAAGATEARSTRREAGADLPLPTAASPLSGLWPAGLSAT